MMLKRWPMAESLARGRDIAADDALIAAPPAGRRVSRRAFARPLSAKRGFARRLARKKQGAVQVALSKARLPPTPKSDGGCRA
jgi:hypothetical protein